MSTGKPLQPPEHPPVEGGGRSRGKRKSTLPGRPLVTVVTVVRNGEDHLEEAIRSVLSQDYANIEYIVVDGASTDGTLEIIRRYDERIDYWVSEPDAGIYEAMNKGIALATGELIGLLNADDIYLEGTVPRVVETALAHPEAGAFHGNLLLRRQNGVEEIRRPRMIREGYRPYLMPVNHPTVFLRASCYADCGSFDAAYRTAADFDLMLRLLYDCRVGFLHIDRTLVCMREGGESGRYNRRTYEDMVTILTKRGRPRREVLRFRAWYLWLLAMQYSKRFWLVRKLVPLYYKLSRRGD